MEIQKAERISELIDEIGLKHELTKRNREVMFCLAMGHTSSHDLAKVLHMSDKTVKNHIHQIMEKMQVGDRAEIMSFVLGWHIEKHIGETSDGWFKLLPVNKRDQAALAAAQLLTDYNQVQVTETTQGWVVKYRGGKS